MSGVPEADLLGHEERVRGQIAAAHAEDLRVVDDLLVCMLRGFLTLGSFTNTPDNRLELAWLLLGTKSFNSLRAATWCTESGYYAQALTLVRSAMEDHLTALDCDAHPETLAALLDGNGVLGRGSMTFAAMAARVSPAFEKSWADNYGKLSEYAAHSRRLAVTHLIEPGSLMLRIGAYYDADLVIGTVDAVLRSLLGIAELLPRVLEGRARAWQNECLGTLEAATEWRARVKTAIESDESGGGGGRA